MFCLNSIGKFIYQTTLSKMYYFKYDILHVYFCQSAMSMTYITNERVKNGIFSRKDNELFI